MLRYVQLVGSFHLVSCILCFSLGEVESVQKEQPLLWQLHDPESHHRAHKVGF